MHTIPLNTQFINMALDFFVLQRKKNITVKENFCRYNLHYIFNQKQNLKTVGFLFVCLFVLIILFETKSHCAAQADWNSSVFLCLSLYSSGIIATSHHAWLGTGCLSCKAFPPQSYIIRINFVDFFFLFKLNLRFS